MVDARVLKKIAGHYLATHILAREKIGALRFEDSVIDVEFFDNFCAYLEGHQNRCSS